MELQNINDDIQSPECIVCLEAVANPVTCSAGAHHYCTGDFIQNVEAISSKTLKANHGRVPCIGCDGGGFFGLDQIASAYMRNGDTALLGQYLRRTHGEPRRRPDSGGAVSAPNSGGDAARLLLAEVVEKLNIRCPNCNDAQDPRPDGCDAVACLNCGCHFCFLCFHISQTNAANHDHVVATHGELFPSEEKRDLHHAHWRVGIIRDFVRDKDADLRTAVADIFEPVWNEGNPAQLGRVLRNPGHDLGLAPLPPPRRPRPRGEAELEQPDPEDDLPELEEIQDGDIPFTLPHTLNLGMALAPGVLVGYFGGKCAFSVFAGIGAALSSAPPIAAAML